MDKLNKEKEVLGIYLSSHPIELIKDKVTTPYVNISALYDYADRQVNVIMQLQRVKNITDRKGNEMCFIEGFDESGSVEGVVFASCFKSVGVALKKGNICLIHGKVDLKDKLSLIVNNARMIE